MMCGRTLLLLAPALIGLCRFAGEAAAQPRAGSAPGSVRLFAGPAGGSGVRDDRYQLLDIDSLFYIENRGLTRFQIELNGHRFKLASDPDEVRQSRNAFPIPQYGEITINIAPYLRPGDDNWMDVVPQGPAGADANLIIGNTFLPGQAVAYVIRDLEEFPEALALLQGYPNPFRESVRIVYTIPEGRTAGVPVQLAVFDATGRRVRVLTDDRRYPGRFVVEWDGTDEDRRAVASGVYFCVLHAGEQRQVRSLLRIR